MTAYARLNGYDRRQILDAAERARRRGRRRRAIGLYRRVLLVEPDDPEMHARLAPLLAESGQRYDAWRSFRHAAREAEGRERLEQALAIYREATRRLPLQVDAWMATARTLARLGRKREALETLDRGAARLSSRWRRGEAIALLRRAHQLAPSRLGSAIALATLLVRTEQRDEALSILEDLADDCEGAELRRVRALQWRITHSLSHLWLWIRACAQRTPAQRSPVAQRTPAQRSPVTQRTPAQRSPVTLKAPAQPSPLTVSRT